MVVETLVEENEPSVRFPPPSFLQFHREPTALFDPQSQTPYYSALCNVQTISRPRNVLQGDMCSVCIRHKSAKSWILNRFFYTIGIRLANTLRSLTATEETGEIKNIECEVTP